MIVMCLIAQGCGLKRIDEGRRYVTAPEKGLNSRFL
jgi:hypothetical protein